METDLLIGNTLFFLNFISTYYLSEKSIFSALGMWQSNGKTSKC